MPYPLFLAFCIIKKIPCHTRNLKKFIAMRKNPVKMLEPNWTALYKDITELTPELLRLFIQEIVAHEKEVKWSKHAPQTVEIHYANIGCVGSVQPHAALPSADRGRWIFSQASGFAGSFDFLRAHSVLSWVFHRRNVQNTGRRSLKCGNQLKQLRAGMVSGFCAVSKRQ